MKKLNRLLVGKNRFYFDYLDHDPNLEKDANIKLLRLLALAPPGAIALGLVEKQDQNYVVTAKIKSPFRSFVANAISSHPQVAVNRSLDQLENELYRWRFGGGSGPYGSPVTVLLKPLPEPLAVGRSWL